MSDKQSLDLDDLITSNPDILGGGRVFRGARAPVEALFENLADGLSLVYSFYAPSESKRSLGAFMILDSIARARALRLPHVYLGYWVEGSRKMAYKAAYLPQERLGLSGWVRIERE